MGPSIINIRENVQFNQAYCDLIYLLDQNYPKKSALTFVANHHNLDSKFRNILNRAAISFNDVKLIQSHLITDPVAMESKNIYIDTYNQLLTLFSYRNRDPLIICRDGVLRDIFQSIHVKRDFQFDHEIITIFLKGLSKLKPENLFLYVDRQISKSKKHAKSFTSILQDLKIKGTCILHKAVDWALKNVSDGFVISHDSTVLLSNPQCFDFFSWYLNLKSQNINFKQFCINFRDLNCQ